MMFDRRKFLTLATIAAANIRAVPLFAQDASTLDQIKSRKQLRIGVTSAEPWFFKDPLSEKWTGVGIAMGEKLAAALGVEMIPVETSWANAIAALQANQIDIMFVLDPTEERRKAIDFPDAPLFYYAMGALVPENATWRSWEDMDKPGVRIGVTLGTSLDKNISAVIKTAAINRFSNNDESVAAFAAKRVDVVVQFHPALIVQYARLKLGKVILPEPASPVATSAGLRKEQNTGFRDWVNAQFLELYKAGVPNQLFGAYLKSKGVDPSRSPGLMAESW